MSPGLLPLPVLASLRSALDQPVFPGKIVVWLLFMISIVGWVMILSKFLQLRKTRWADQEFTERLRRSKATLEVFEEGWEDEHSLKHLVYQSGARETAYQLLGSREPQEMMQHRLRQAGKLAGRQLEFLRLAFRSGYRAAFVRLRTGIEGLRIVSTTALLLGTLGFIWTLMSAFDEADDFAAIAPRVGGALGFLALGLLVAGPAAIARRALAILVQKRGQELERFRDDIHRLFERSFAAPVEPVRTTPAESRPATSAATRPEPLAPPSPLGPAAPSVEPGEGKKRFHSIRDRLLRSEEEEEASSPFRVNPIARQAASAGGALRGY